jgi:hypothetical protein
MVLPACVFVTTAVVLTILATIFTAILTPVFSAVLASRRLVRLAGHGGCGKQGAGHEQGSTQLCKSFHSGLLMIGATARLAVAAKITIRFRAYSRASRSPTRAGRREYSSA